MKHRYQKPHQSITPYIRTVLILEGFIESDTAKQPLFTNGMHALVCKTEKRQGVNEHIQLTLFGKSTTPDCWAVEENTTIIAYFFNPFAMACLFNIPVKKMMEAPMELCYWNPHKINALRTQLMYATDTDRKVEVLDNLLIHQLQLNKRECEIIKYATDEMMYNPGTEILSVLYRSKQQVKEKKAVFLEQYSKQHRFFNVRHRCVTNEEDG
jgi:hypothetical protein